MVEPSLSYLKLEYGLSNDNDKYKIIIRPKSDLKIELLSSDKLDNQTRFQA